MARRQHQLDFLEAASNSEQTLYGPGNDDDLQLYLFYLKAYQKYTQNFERHYLEIMLFQKYQYCEHDCVQTIRPIFFTFFLNYSKLTGAVRERCLFFT